jgi:hypothetical protein
MKSDVSEYKTKTVAGIGRFLTQAIVRPRRQADLSSKQLHGAAFSTVKDSEYSSKILRDIDARRSNAFFRFGVAGRADCFPTLANIQRWINKDRENCAICGEERKSTFAHILNEYRANLPEMTKRQNRLSDEIRRARRSRISHF